ncbi:amidase domain-containing protein, partial [Bacillus thuringiensis]|uniref:amidase domain-containing protein n=1 Tax=Bacillus thuringiensis TaxID=1428 RepID=UPI001642840F
YNPLHAVKYPQRWWDHPNPMYPNFPHNSTNFISQSLHTRQLPINPYPNIPKPSSQTDNHSTSTSPLPHSFYSYFSPPTTPLP